MTFETDPEELGLPYSDSDEPEQDDEDRSFESDGSRHLFSLHLSPKDMVSFGRGSIAKLAAIGFAEALAVVALALLLRRAVDDLVYNQSSTGYLIILVCILIAVALFSAWVRWMEFSVSESIGYSYVNRLRMVMYSHLQRMHGRQLQKISRGGILLRFTGDLAMIRNWVSRGIARAWIASMSIIAGIAVLVYFKPAMGLVVVGILGIGAGLSLPAGALVRRAARSVRRQRSNLTTNLADQINGMVTIQAMGRISGEYDRLGRQSTRLTQRLAHYAWVRGRLRSISVASGYLAVIGVVIVGALSIDSGQTTVGTVLAAMLVVRQMIRPIRVLGQSYDYWQSARISQEKIVRFLQYPYREKDDTEHNRLRVRNGSIEFHNVSLDGSLNGVTAEVKSNQIVAIMGPNGAGKTSLLSIVSRIADPDDGEVLIDGQVLANCSLRSCAAQISLMSSELPLLRGSLRRNILYRWREAPEEELERVIKLCELREVIDQFPDGLSAVIKESGANLSAGHAARISLARALVGNPKILLLDEPTLNLDDKMKQILREVVLHYGGTVLLVTHDPEEAAMADIVWQMQGGKIIAMLSGKIFRESIKNTPQIPKWARAEDRP